MREQKIRYADAGMDIKKLVLCFAKRIWLAAAAGAAGAVIGGLVYLMVSVVPEAEREYQAISKVYLDFAPDETGEIYQAYNGYTWNDLMATDPILDVTMKYLPATYSREDVMGATKAEILSDLRLLTITVTTHDADSCNAILQATGQSLTDRGREAKEFRRIEVIRTTEAALVVADSRLVQAVLIGLVLGAAAALLGMLLYYVLDDRIMVAADLRQVTDVPFVGYGGAGGQLQEEYEAGLAYLREKKGKIIVHALVQGEMLPPERWQALCNAQGVVLEMPWGKVHGVYLSYVLEQFRLRECPVVGVAVGSADRRFLGRYYGRTD